MAGNPPPTVPAAPSPLTPVQRVRERSRRRRWPDRVVGALGILLVIATIVLFFNWEAQVVVEPAYGIQWVESPSEPQVLEGFVGHTGPAPPGGQLPDVPNPEERTISIAAENLTRVVVAVDITDDIGTSVSHGDEFEVTVRFGNDSLVAQTQRGIAPPDEPRRFLFSFDLASLPNVTRAPVASEPEARAYVSGLASALGRGDWMVSVELLRANGTEPANDSPFPCDAPVDEALERADQCRVDRGNAFTVTSLYFTYAPAFSKIS